MKNIYLIAAALLTLAAGCEDRKYVNTRMDPTPPPMVADVEATGKTLAIEVSWSNPEEGKFSYVQIDYTEPATGKTVTQRVKYPQTSWELTGITEADGAVSFNVLTVSASGVRSKTSETVEATALDPEPYTPPMVLNAQATPIAGGIRINWENPDQSAGEYAAVKIEYSKNGAAGTQTATVDYPETTWTLAELTAADGEISFKLYTVTSDGAKSKTSATVKATALDPVPPAPVTGLQATAGEGTVSLSWTNPVEEIAYVQVAYTDPREGATKGQTVTLKADYPATSILIENLLNRHGEITFTVSTFSEAGIESEYRPTVNATANPVPPVTEIQKEKIPLEIGMLSGKNIIVDTGSDGGALPAIIDGNPETYLHTYWWDPLTMPNEQHWIQIDLGENPLDTFTMIMTARHNNKGGTLPGELIIRGSNDASDWTGLKTFYGKTTADGEGDLPFEAGAVYETPVMGTTGTTYRYIQYYATKGCDPNGFFCLAELELYKAKEVIISDPEND